MNEELTLSYVDKITGHLAFSSDLLSGTSTLIPLDIICENPARKLKVNIAVILGGCTRFIQPADLSVLEQVF